MSRTNRAPVIDSDHPAHPALRPDTLDEPPQPVGIPCRRQPAKNRAVVADQADVQPPATEIQAARNMKTGLLELALR